MDFWTQHEANCIEAGERHHAERLGCEGSVLIPTPSAAQKAKLEARGVRVGDVQEEGPGDVSLSDAVLPEKWTLTQSSPNDPRHRVIKDAAGVVVASIFIKMGAYDNYASINLSE